MRLLTAGSLVRAQLEEPKQTDTKWYPFCFAFENGFKPLTMVGIACETWLLGARRKEIYIKFAEMHSL